jgi:hypothetical protein
MSPCAVNVSPAMSMRTVVVKPVAVCETQARKWRTTSSYTFCEDTTKDTKMNKRTDNSLKCLTVKGVRLLYPTKDFFADEVLGR